jgi:hypothetical protein
MVWILDKKQRETCHHAGHAGHAGQRFIGGLTHRRSPKAGLSLLTSDF